MLIPEQAADCQLCAGIPGTQVAVSSVAVGTIQLTSPTSLEAEKYPSAGATIPSWLPSGRAPSDRQSLADFLRESLLVAGVGDSAHQVQIAIHQRRQRIVRQNVVITVNQLHLHASLGGERARPARISRCDSRFHPEPACWDGGHTKTTRRSQAQHSARRRRSRRCSGCEWTPARARAGTPLALAITISPSSAERPRSGAAAAWAGLP